MGSLNYGAGSSIEFDDRVLAHLQVVMSAKLRRSEGFFFSWAKDPAVGGGRTSIWIAPYIPLEFAYKGDRMPSLNRAWLEEMAVSAGTNQGLVLTPEPVADETAA